MRIFYYINNQEVNRPLNWKELSVELNYDKDDVSSQAVSLTEFEWGLGDQTDGNDAARLINAHRTGGLTNGVGVFEGLPFRIELEIENNSYQLFDGYLNTATSLYDCDKVIISAVEKGNIDWLNDVADSVSFEYLYDVDNERGLNPLARITNSDFISVPYVLSELPDTREALLATISLTFLLETISTQLEEVIELAVDLPNVLNWTTAIKFLLRIIYLISLFLLLLVTVKRIINLLIQKTKYHAVMRAKTLCEKGAAHFGFTFESSILSGDYKDLVILPRKFNHNSTVETYGNAGALTGAKDTLIGFFSANQNDMRGYYDGTFGDLLRGLKEMFNAKVIIEGNVLKLEREDYNNSAYNYVLPPIDDLDFSLNFEDLKSNYTVEFLTDLNDKNTLQNYDGTITQITTQPKATINEDMVLMTGLEQRLIPFARATRKTELTSVEKIVDFIAPIIDGVAAVIVEVVNAALEIVDIILNTELVSQAILISNLGAIAYATIGVIINNATWKIPDALDWFNNNIYDTGLDLNNIPRLEYEPIADSIETRIGMLLMENDWVDVPKIFLIDENNNPLNTNIKTTNNSIINTESLYNNFHFLRIFVGNNDNPEGNQWKKYSLDGIPFSCDDYLLLRNNNRLQDSDNRNGELVSCRFNPENLTADVEYRINERYTNNLKIEVITPDGK